MSHKILKPLIVSFISLIAFASCGNRRSAVAESRYTALEDSLAAMVADVPGEVGIAVIVDGRDTVCVGNVDIYPMMSVFKLHQAVALCHEFDRRGTSIDTVISVERKSLNENTWSPMLKDYAEPRFDISAKELMLYALEQSDNNASNLMFERLVPVERADSIISTIIPRGGFRIAVREADMQHDHALSYANHSSPLATVILLERLFNDSILSPVSREFICDALRSCKTGVDRISAPLSGKAGVVIAHKTGSGYINERGELTAHNDAAYITLPDGRDYTLLVFIKDLACNEKNASAIISRISEAVYDYLGNDYSAK